MSENQTLIVRFLARQFGLDRSANDHRNRSGLLRHGADRGRYRGAATASWLECLRTPSGHRGRNGQSPLPILPGVLQLKRRALKRSDRGSPNELVGMTLRS